MCLFQRILFTFCLFTIVSGSIFDLIQLVDKDNGDCVIRIRGHSNAPPLDIVFNINEVILSGTSFQDCSISNKLCRKYGETYLMVNKLNNECQSLNYSSSKEHRLRATFDIKNIHLYGGAEHKSVKWPVDKMTYERNSYVTKINHYQAILEPYWLTSNGYYVYVGNGVPLFISQDSGIFELIAENQPPYWKKDAVALNFTVCKLNDARQAQEHAIEHFLGKPLTVPDVRRVSQPIWSTWVRYKDNIDEKTTLRYAREIVKHGYGGQLEIDDNWERCYGSLQPDTKKFKDLKRLVGRLKKLKFRVTIWVHPFVNVNCNPTYAKGLKKGLFVKDASGQVLMNWWRGNASYIDFTNVDARNWYRKRLIHLREAYGIDSFKFDGGESSYSPQPAVYHRMADDYPETIVKAYVKLIASFDPNVHTRVARGTQQHAIFVTMMDRESDWSGNLGLTSVIPQLLQMNVLGYSFVLPDMIAGNFYGKKASGELFIRWLQLNTFMPSLQFSIPPWYFDDEVVLLAKKFVDLHSNYSSLIIQLMEKNAKTGAPVNPPIWWIAPNDPVALTCDSEFLLGEDILVAPVLVEGAKSRDIYLPAGFWKDENVLSDVVIRGPTWLRNYNAGLDTLPYFKLISSDKIVSEAATVRLPTRTPVNTFAIISIIVPLSFVMYLGRRMMRRYVKSKRFIRK